MGNESHPAPAVTLSMDDLLEQQSWVRALAYRLVRDSAAADDLVQETWLAALAHPPLADRPLRPWLAQVVRNFARMRQRGDANRARREQAVARTDELPSADELVDRVEQSRMLAKTVLALEEPYRTIVLLRYFEGLSSADIARRTGVPAATVRWRLMRALESLRTELDGRHGGDRRAWCLALAPLCRTAALPAGAALAAQIALSFTVVGFALACVWLGWRFWQGGTHEAELAVVTVDTPRAADDSDDNARGRVLEQDARRPAAALPAAPARESAAGIEPAVVIARAVDAHGDPIAGAALRVLAGSAGDGRGASRASNADGRAELAFLPIDHDGLCTLELSASGRVPRALRARVPESASIHLGDVELSEAGALAGRVQSPDGRPIAGARVLIERLPSRWLDVAAQPLREARYLGSLLGPEAPSTETAADGSYRFPALPSGYVRVWANAEGRVGAYLDAVAVHAGSVANAPALTLAPPVDREHIQGTVLDPDGAPVPMAEIQAARRSLRALFFRGEGALSHARADARGRFSIVVDPNTQCDVVARDPEGRFRPSKITHTRSGASGLELRLAPWRELELAVTDPHGTTIEGARVELFDGDGVRRLEPESLAASLPRIRAPHVPFTVRVSHSDCATAVLGPFDPEKLPERAECRLAELADLRGAVRGGGQAVADARVEWLRARADGSWRFAPAWCDGGACVAQRFDAEPRIEPVNCDAQGHFQIAHPGAGTFYLRIEADGWATALLGPLELEPSQPSAALDVDLAQGGAIAGRVRSEKPEHAAGVIVGVSNGDGTLRSARVGADGAFRFEHLAAGRWQVLELARETDRTGWYPLGGSLKEAVAGSTVPWTVEVIDGETTQHELTLARDVRGRLDGSLRFDGASPGPWLVHLEPLSGAGTSKGVSKLAAGLDPAGRFTFEGLEPGTYALTISNSGYRPVATTVRDEITIAGGRTPWSADLATGRLSGDHAPRPHLSANEAYHVWRGGGQLTCTTRIEAADGAGEAGGPFDLHALPAGRSQIVKVPRGGDPLADGAPLLDLVLPPGGESRIVLQPMR